MKRDNLYEIGIDSHYEQRLKILPIELNKTLDEKIKKSLSVIKEYVDFYKKDKYQIAYSGGKDSQVMLLLCMKVIPIDKIELWKDNDIFEYLKKNWYIPDIYNYVKRTGCITCPFGWKEKRTYIKTKLPQLYDKIMNSPLGKMYRDLGIEK